MPDPAILLTLIAAAFTTRLVIVSTVWLATPPATMLTVATELSGSHLTSRFRGWVMQALIWMPLLAASRMVRVPAGTVKAAEQPATGTVTDLVPKV